MLFVQAWNEDEKSPTYNPKVADYAVFFATSQKPGKDNSGEYIYRLGADNSPMLDSHGHMIVEHDLDEIADAFLKWGKKDGISFCEEIA